MKNLTHQNEAQAQLHQAMASLDPLERSVLMLHDYEGFAAEDIAEITDLSITEIPLMISAARAKMAAFLNQQQITPARLTLEAPAVTEVKAGQRRRFWIPFFFSIAAIILLIVALMMYRTGQNYGYVQQETTNQTTLTPGNTVATQTTAQQPVPTNNIPHITTPVKRAAITPAKPNICRLPVILPAQEQPATKSPAQQTVKASGSQDFAAVDPLLNGEPKRMVSPMTPLLPLRDVKLLPVIDKAVNQTEKIAFAKADLQQSPDPTAPRKRSNIFRELFTPHSYLEPEEEVTFAATKLPTISFSSQ